MISGHITVCKIYKDGTKEIVLDKSNIITKGLGSAYVDILVDNGSTLAEDYRPRFFQLGTSSIGYDTQVVDTSAYFYQLSTPLLWSAYGDDTNILVEQRSRGLWASTVLQSELVPGDPEVLTATELLFYTGPVSSLVFSSVDNSSSWFATLSKKNVTKWFIDSCETEIILNEDTANGNTITEIGLFSRNPKGLGAITPLLMAYKKFTGIPKTSDFSLAFYWSIGFMGTSSIDRGFTGGRDILLRAVPPAGYHPYTVGRQSDLEAEVPTFNVWSVMPLPGEEPDPDVITPPPGPPIPVEIPPATPTQPDEVGDY